MDILKILKSSFKKAGYKILKWQTPDKARTYYTIRDYNRADRYSNIKYCGCFEVDGDKVSVCNGYVVLTNPDIQDILEAVTNYEKTLPYSLELSDPIYREEYVLGVKLQEYLEALGFKKEGSNHAGDIYVIHNILHQSKIEICVDIKEKDGIITGTIMSSHGSSCISHKFSTYQEGVKSVNSVIAPEALLLAMQCVSILKNMDIKKCELANMTTIDMASCTMFDTTKEYSNLILAKMKEYISIMENVN